MICSGCEIWEEKERLRAEISELKELLSQRDARIAELELLNGKLKRHLATYEKTKTNIGKKLPRRLRERSKVRSPGKPKGSPGSHQTCPKTRPGR